MKEHETENQLMRNGNMDILKLLEAGIEAELQKRLSKTSSCEKQKGNEAPFSIFLGEKVLIRANRDGVNIGVVHHIDSEFVYLKDARKFWRWHAARGIALESFVESGPREGTRATAFNPLMSVRLDDICGAKIVSDEIWQEFINWPISEQD